MFERFADNARSVVVAAQQEAVRVHEPRIEASHLLVGAAIAADEPLRALLGEAGLTVDVLRSERAARADDDSPFGAEDAAALEAIGIDLDEVRARLEATFGKGVLDRGSAGRRGLASRFGHIPFDRAAKKSLELALREAIARRERVIRAEHILLGLLRSDDPSTTALVEARIPREQLRQRLNTHLDTAA
ncbi:Clp protease N-terminal domain-containing protein [Rhodococcus sp. NPDC047139]|uniref:Clp protease N-terminal domain-containing protein n=1 Tax=Rhodococcus sp. NPDC047139 TaxID=3155141 RepID=UPI0033C0CEF0